MRKLIEFVPQDAAWVLKSIHAELWDTQDTISRYENGEFDLLPEEHKAWVGSARHYRGVLRAVTARIALLKMSPTDRLVDQVTDCHEHYESHGGYDEPEMWGPCASTYIKEAYDALNRDDDLAAWKAIIRMNQDLDEQHQPNTLYLPNKRFWPELRINKEAVTLQTIDRMIAESEET